MAITITQQPAAAEHFSAFCPLPIICTSNRSGIVNIKATVKNDITGATIATIRKPLDVGSSTQFTIDIYPITQSLVTFDYSTAGVHFQCSNSLLPIYVYLEEEYLSGGVIVLGSTATGNIFYVHNYGVDAVDDTASNLFNTNFLTSATTVRIGSSDKFFLQIIRKNSNYVKVKYVVTYDDNSTATFYSTPAWSTNQRWALSVGTYFLINGLGASANIKSYVVSVANGSGTDQTTVPVTFVIDNSCAISPYRVSFLNRKGGFDTFTFKTKEVLSQSVKKELWTKPKTISSSYDWTREQQTTGQFTANVSINSKVVSQPLKRIEANWLKELMFAKVVYVENYYTALGLHVTIPTPIVLNDGDLTYIDAMKKDYKIEFDATFANSNYYGIG